MKLERSPAPTPRTRALTRAVPVPLQLLIEAVIAGLLLGCFYAAVSVGL